MSRAVKERPILFSGPMVRAVLDGTKTETRRVVTPQPEWNGARWVWPIPRSKVNPGCCTEVVGASREWWEYLTPNQLPYGQPGDRLWVRETFQLESNWMVREIPDYRPPFDDGRPVRWVEDEDIDGAFWEQCHYAATDPCPELMDPATDGISARWRPSIHMPRWASRLTLEATGVRAERVQDICELECYAEGIPNSVLIDPDEECERVIERFRALWDSINAKRGFGWDTNPWVWVVSFRRIAAAEASP